MSDHESEATKIKKTIVSLTSTIDMMDDLRDSTLLPVIDRLGFEDVNQLVSDLQLDALLEELEYRRNELVN